MNKTKLQEPKEGNISTSADMNSEVLQTLTGRDVSHDEIAAENDDLAGLRAENEQLKATIRNAAAHRQITGELERVGARSPELLFEAVKGDLQFSPDGAVANAAAIVERLRRGFPEQFGAGVPPASIDAGAGFTPTPRLTRDTLAKMKPAEIAKLDWEDVKRTLAQN